MWGKKEREREREREREGGRERESIEKFINLEKDVKTLQQME